MTNYRHAQMKSIIGTIESPKLTVHVDRCLLVRNRNAECLRCAEVCTTGAIALTDEGITVFPEQCIGCGTCASACPSGCLEAANPTDEQLFDQVAAVLAANQGRAALICETAWAMAADEAADGDAPFQPGAVVAELPDGTPAIGVVCLGRADESLLVEATARDARSVKLVSGRCDTCAHHCGGTLCDEIVASANNLIEALGVPSPIERIRLDDADSREFQTMQLRSAANTSEHGEYSVAPAGEEPQHRRAEFRRTAPGARTALIPGDRKDFTPEFVHVQADGTLPHFVPERRLRLFNSLKALGTPQKATVDTRLWGQVDIDTELCRSCRMCTVFCPTGAVARFDAGGGAFGVEHRSALCMQCRLCEVICPEQAITVHSEVSLPEFMGGTKFRFTMQPIGWNPGQEDAIATRMARFIKVDNVQEPQAKVKLNDTAERRAYAQQREARRREIRGE